MAFEDGASENLLDRQSRYYMNDADQKDVPLTALNVAGVGYHEDLRETLDRHQAKFSLFCYFQLSCASIFGCFWGVSTSYQQSHNCFTSPASRLAALTLASQAVLSVLVISLIGKCYVNKINDKESASSGAIAILFGVEHSQNTDSKTEKQNENIRLLTKNIKFFHSCRIMIHVLRFAFIALPIYFIVKLGQEKWAPWCVSPNQAASSTVSYALLTATLVLPQLACFLLPPPDLTKLKSALQDYVETVSQKPIPVPLF